MLIKMMQCPGQTKHPNFCVKLSLSLILENNCKYQSLKQAYNNKRMNQFSLGYLCFWNINVYEYLWKSAFKIDSITLKTFMWNWN